MDKAKYKVGRMLRFFLKNVSGRYIERKILLPRYSIRSTISLNCFVRPRYIHRKNFLNPFERKQRAIEFLNEFKKISFDPYGDCFDDPYYRYDSIENNF